MTVAAVVLAAGAGSRFSGPTHKLLADLDGRPVVCHALDAVVAAGFDEVIVVDGAVELTALVPAGVTLVHNPDWAQGQAGSLRRAVAVAAAAGHEAVVVGLGDQPRVRSPWPATGRNAVTRSASGARFGRSCRRRGTRGPAR